MPGPPPRERIWYGSVVALSRFGSSGTLRAVEIRPVEPRWDGPRDAERGIPRLAGPPVADRILSRLSRLSAPFGTRIAIGEGGGHLVR